MTPTSTSGASSAKQVIVFPRGQLRAADRKELNAAGFVVVEADDPKAVVTHIPAAPLVTANEMLLAALSAMCSSSGDANVRSAFTHRLEVAMRAKATGVAP